MRDVSKVDVEGISDEQILHSAVGILRCDIEKLKISVDDYPLEGESFKGLLKNAIIRNMNVSVRLNSGTTIT
jgi:hypothetical protein